MSEMDVRIIGGVRNYVKLFFGHAFSVCPKTVDFGLGENSQSLQDLSSSDAFVSSAMLNLERLTKLRLCSPRSTPPT